MINKLKISDMYNVTDVFLNVTMTFKIITQVIFSPILFFQFL